MTKKTAEGSQEKGVSNKDERLERSDRDVSSEAQNTENKYCVEEYVVAVYSGQWHIGRVTQDDKDKEEVEISFMTRKKDNYQ